MIKSKKCKLCDKPAFSKGFCQQHGNKTEIKSNNTPIKSKNKTIKNKTVKSADKKIERSEIRDVYFKYHIERCSYSENSGKPINEPNRSNICHLIDKGRHPSLQDHLDNFIYLTFLEHERFDQLLFSLRFEDIEKEFENSWNLACIRYKKLLPLCAENTNFTRQLKKYLDGR